MARPEPPIFAFVRDRLLVSVEGRDVALPDPDGLEALVEVEVDWFGVHEIPRIPPSYSIARELVDAFAVEHGRDPASLPEWRIPE